MKIKTERLELIPYSVEVAEAAIADKYQIEKLLNVQVPSDWPWSEVEEVLPFFAQLAADPLQLGWGAWLIIHSQENMIIGDLGFGGKNEQGIAEIGYNILPAYQKQGYGFEAVQALVNWALTQPGLHKIIATCPQGHLSSMRILEKLGMQLKNCEEGLLKWEMAL
ncbi:MAG TPA: GNAT family N-acetyltransferase [Kamptonema sp.]|nr:GNAT family N-acetyltransferase [Kamptonema sp.]